MDSQRVKSPDVIHPRKKRKKNDNATFKVMDIPQTNTEEVTDKEFSQLCHDYGYNNYINTNNNSKNKNKTTKKRTNNINNNTNNNTTNINNANNIDNSNNNNKRNNIKRNKTRTKNSNNINNINSSNNISNINLTENDNINTTNNNNNNINNITSNNNINSTNNDNNNNINTIDLTQNNDNSNAIKIGGQNITLDTQGIGSLLKQNDFTQYSLKQINNNGNKHSNNTNIPILNHNINIQNNNNNNNIDIYTQVDEDDDIDEVPDPQKLLQNGNFTQYQRLPNQTYFDEREFEEHNLRRYLIWNFGITNEALDIIVPRLRTSSLNIKTPSDIIKLVDPSLCHLLWNILQIKGSRFAELFKSIKKERKKKYGY